jgi:hypothetical protein
MNGLGIEAEFQDRGLLRVRDLAQDAGACSFEVSSSRQGLLLRVKDGDQDERSGLGHRA